jgi:hypothetical protein
MKAGKGEPKMAEMFWTIVTILGICAASFAQGADYYKAIQTRSSTQAKAAQFKQMEENALNHFSQAGSYDVLATSFGNTTEKVWAVIYGEIYCNLSSDSDRISQIGSLVYHWYEESLSRQGNGLSANLTENAQSSTKQVPFESLFEQSFLMGALGSKSDFPPLSIQELIVIRKNQLFLWDRKKLPRRNWSADKKPSYRRATLTLTTTGCSKARVPMSSVGGLRATRTSFKRGSTGRARTSSRSRLLTSSASIYCGSRTAAAQRLHR